jgi:hypothetical protein
MVHPLFHRLLEGYELARDGPPGDLAKAVRALPRVGRLPSPWETRALPVLLEYRRHTLTTAMTGEEVCTHWGDFVDFIGLRRQGLGCSAAVKFWAAIEPSLDYRLTDDFPPIEPSFDYGPTDDFIGASLDLELTDDLAPDESYQGRFDHPKMAMLTVTAVDLIEAGALITRWYDPPCYLQFAIADEVLKHESVVNAFYEDAEEPAVKVWRHASVGDWIAAAAAALAMGNATLRKLTGERAEQCREDRLDRIYAHMVRDKGVTPRVLKALDDFDPAYSTPHLADALKVDHPAVRTALKLVAARDDPVWVPAVRRLIGSLGSVYDPDEVADLTKDCKQFLDRHGTWAIGAMITTPKVKAGRGPARAPDGPRGGPRPNASGAADVLKLVRADPVPRASQEVPTPSAAPPPACAASTPQSPPEPRDGDAKPTPKERLVAARAKLVERGRESP